MRKTNTIKLVISGWILLLLLPPVGSANDVTNPDALPAQSDALPSQSNALPSQTNALAAQGGLSLSLSNSRDCLTARVAADRELRLAVMPEIESSFLAQAETVPSSGQDRTRTRTRIGMSYDIAALARALTARGRADEECDAQGQGAARLIEEINLLRKRRILAGAAAAAKVYAEALPGARRQRLTLDESLKKGLISLRESDDFSEYLLEIELRTSEFQELLDRARAAETDQHIRAEVLEFFEPRAHSKISDGQDLETHAYRDPSSLIQLALNDELKIATRRAEQRTGNSWNLRIAGGYEQLSRSEGRPAIPGYATAELRYKLGSLWPDSSPLEDARSAESGNLPSPSIGQAVAATVRREITDYQRDQDTWAKQFALIQRRAVEFGERAKLEESTLKSDPHAATRKGMLEISRNRLNLTARAADLGARVGKSDDKLIQPEKTKNSTDLGKKLNPMIFDVTAGTVENRPQSTPVSPKAKETQLRSFASSETELVNRPNLTRITSSPTMRMHAIIPTPNRVSLAFRYKGSVSKPVPLAGGDVRNQLGIFLLGKDQCNLLYVMLRFNERGSKAKVTLAVQSKSNPKQSTHQECGNHGYTTLPPRAQNDIPDLVLNDGKIHVLTASAKSKDELEVTLDDRLVWSGQFPKEFAARLDKQGMIGVRSDNAVFEFEASDQSLSASQFGN